MDVGMDVNRPSYGCLSHPANPTSENNGDLSCSLSQNVKRMLPCYCLHLSDGRFNLGGWVNDSAPEKMTNRKENCVE